MFCSIRKTLAFTFPIKRIAGPTPHPTSHFDSRLVQSMSSVSSQRIFQLKLDPLTGNSEWVVVEEDETPEDSSKPLLATTSYLDMLNDSRRNRAFREAIDKTVTKPCHVIDIGAGTGLLSMMAARAMGLGNSSACSSLTRRVIAFESYLPMVKLMRKVLHVNNMDRKVRVISKRSDELEVGMDIISRADVLVSEILDSELLGEGLIPSLQHAHDKLLVENPQTVPYRATIYGQLVENTYLWKLHDLYNNEANAPDGIRLVPTGLETILCVKPQQHAMHLDAIQEKLELLSEPFKIFEFDFWKRPESNREIELRIKATNAGTVHAVISWWILQLDSEGTIFYSTGPKWIRFPFNMKESQPSFSGVWSWSDHWKQCVWFVPGKGLSISKDEEVHLHAMHTETSISYNLKTHVVRSDVGHCYHFAQNFHLFLSPERIAIYGDSNWRGSMIRALKNALQRKVCSLCIVADDSLFLTISVAHLSKTPHIISLFPGLRQNGAQYLKAVAAVNGYSMDRVEILDKRSTHLNMHDTRHKKVDFLIGEPFYCGNENMLPWQNLRFWKERTILDQILSNDVLIMPCKGILKGCAMFLPDLWKSRRCLKDVEGFDHSVVNYTLGACGDLPASHESPCLPFSIWQCGQIKKLSEIFVVMDFDFSQPISPCSGKAQVKFTELGICHGFVLWIDWVMDAEHSIVLSTGPDQRHWKQGVKLLTNPVAVAAYGSSTGECCTAEIEASFDPAGGKLIIGCTFS